MILQGNGTALQIRTLNTKSHNATMKYKLLFFWVNSIIDKIIKELQPKKGFPFRVNLYNLKSLYKKKKTNKGNKTHPNLSNSPSNSKKVAKKLRKKQLHYQQRAKDAA